MYNYFSFYFKRFYDNLGKKGSNLQPSDSESDALPIKLFPIILEEIWFKTNNYN